MTFASRLVGAGLFTDPVVQAGTVPRNLNSIELHAHS